MINVLRRTFSRRGLQRPQSSRQYQDTAVDGRPSESGIHIPAPDHIKRKSLMTVCVVLLDETYVSADVHKNAIGKVLYEQIVSYHLDLIEADYFGLKFVDSNQVSHWLDETKKISKQVKTKPPYTFYMRVKFYSSEPNLLQEELTRYQFFLQLKQDIKSGKLKCSYEENVQLAAYCLQSELGDYEANIHTPYFISEFRFIPNQSESFELAVVDAYKQSKGQSPAEAESNYLNLVKRKEMYGVDMHYVKGKDANNYKLGLTPTGILVFEEEEEIGLFIWPNIRKLDFNGRRLKIVVVDLDDKNVEHEHSFVFHLDHPRACKHLWKCAVEHHSFFRLKTNCATVRKQQMLLRTGSKFRPSVRTEFQITRNHGSRKSVNFERRPSKRYSRRTSLRKNTTPRSLTTGDDVFTRYVPENGPSAPPARPPKKSNESQSSQKRSTRSSSGTSYKPSTSRSSTRLAYGIEV